MMKQALPPTGFVNPEQSGFFCIVKKTA